MLILVVLYLVVPLGTALAFGLTNGSSIDFSALQRIFSNPDFGQTLLTSLELALATTIIMIALVTPTLYWTHLRLPRARPLLEFLSLVPFAMGPAGLEARLKSQARDRDNGGRYGLS